MQPVLWHPSLSQAEITVAFARPACLIDWGHTCQAWGREMDKKEVGRVEEGVSMLTAASCKPSKDAK